MIVFPFTYFTASPEVESPNHRTSKVTFNDEIDEETEMIPVTARLSIKSE